MKSIVEKIIRGVNKGHVFDSHYVIDTIIRNYSDDYLIFAAKNPASAKCTEYLHGNIAKLIASFEGKDEESCVQKLPYRSLSYNIRGNVSSCALWKRI
ncbi:hypothetical protein VU04_06660 [Desulfobulbus sp. TB]|nr:hypothetical protein [Desulfobulbus sp. TB]